MDDHDDSSGDGGDSDMNLDSSINNAVVYILGVEESHFPIKRSDITKHALPTKSGKKFPYVIMEVKKILEKTFGLILKDLDGNEKLYVTVSKFQKPESTNLLHFTPESRRKRVLLLIVLSYLFMHDDSVSEDKLWKYLIQLQLVDRTLNFVHPHFGNVRRLCTTDFVRQMYLKVEKVPGSDPPENVYKWGLRANDEFSKLEVLKFVGLMQSNIEPERFTTQWAKIRKEQEEGDIILEEEDEDEEDDEEDTEEEETQVERRSRKAPVKSSQKRRRK